MISINESDINIITILDEKLEDTDATPMTLLEKRCMDGKKYYLISYSLSELVGKFSRCECCGTIYDSNLDHCPECGGERLMIAIIPDIPEIIYQALESGKTVIIGSSTTDDPIRLEL